MSLALAIKKQHVESLKSLEYYQKLVAEQHFEDMKARLKAKFKNKK